MKQKTKQEKMTEDNLILGNVYEENINTTISDYFLNFKGKEIRVFRKCKYSDVVGEMEDVFFEFESEIDLTKEDEETIASFCRSQE